MLTRFLCIILVAMVFFGCDDGDEDKVETVEPEAEMEFEYEFRMPKTIVKNVRTSYQCAYVDPPEGLFHAIKFSVLAENDLVHHIILYDAADTFTKVPQPCGDEMPPLKSLVWGWAVGGSAAVLPDHLGIALGTKSHRKHHVLEIHYDNPSELVGIEDSSGFIVTLTNRFRPVNGGILLVGPQPTEKGIHVPPRQWHHTYGECSRETTQVMMKKPIKLLWYGLHAHLLAKAVWVDVWDSTKHDPENGSPEAEWETIVSDPYYDFDYQRFIPLTEAVTVHKGDGIRTHCLYDNSEGEFAVTGGDATNQEMCIAFFVYEPEDALRFSSCFDPRKAEDLILDANISVPLPRSIRSGKASDGGA